MFDVIDEISKSSLLDEALKISDTPDTIGEWGALLINVLIGISFSLSIIGIAMSAVLYILSAGNPDNTKKAWSAFLYSFIAGCVTIALIAIRMMIFKAVGLNEEYITS